VEAARILLVMAIVPWSSFRVSLTASNDGIGVGCCKILTIVAYCAGRVVYMCVQSSSSEMASVNPASC
jgi:hypothetical protein